MQDKDIQTHEDLRKFMKHLGAPKGISLTQINRIFDGLEHYSPVSDKEIENNIDHQDNFYKGLLSNKEQVLGLQAAYRADPFFQRMNRELKEKGITKEVLPPTVS